MLLLVLCIVYLAQWCRRSRAAQCVTVDGDLVGDINNSAGSVAHPPELVPCTSCIKKELSFWKPLLLNRG